MIGDWVTITEPDNFHGYVGKVTIINNETGYVTVHIPNMHLHAVFVHDLQPIQLNEEILVKNGFKKIHFNRYFLGQSDLKNEIYYELGGWIQLHYSDMYHDISTCTYVHEFQHSLKIFKIEKEIVL